MKAFIALTYFLAPIFAKAIDTRQASTNAPPANVTLTFSYPESKDGKPYPHPLPVTANGISYPVGGDHLTSHVQRTGEGTICEIMGPTSPTGQPGIIATLTDDKDIASINFKGAPMESRILSARCYKAPKKT